MQPERAVQPDREPETAIQPETTVFPAAPLGGHDEFLVALDDATMAAMGAEAALDELVEESVPAVMVLCESPATMKATTTATIIAHSITGARRYIARTPAATVTAAVHGAKTTPLSSPLTNARSSLSSSVVVTTLVAPGRKRSARQRRLMWWNSSPLHAHMQQRRHMQRQLQKSRHQWRPS